MIRSSFAETTKAELSLLWPLDSASLFNSGHASLPDFVFCFFISLAAFPH